MGPRQGLHAQLSRKGVLPKQIAIDPIQRFLLNFNFPLGTKIEFKFIVISENGNVQWEELQKNRKYKLKHPRVMLKAAWNDYEGKEIIEKRQSSSIQLD